MLGGQAVDCLDEVGEGAGKSIQTPDDERVTLTEVGKGYGEAWTLLFGPCDLIGEDVALGAAGLL